MPIVVEQARCSRNLDGNGSGGGDGDLGENDDD